ncbi:MAG: PDZ domain-containing protein, partial [Nitrospirae bacterium]|nr:PDZ domain-containing protein [Nitrospirota bacterium]
MPSTNGNIVEAVEPGSPSDRAGIKPGDIIHSINRHRIHDSLDLMFYANEPLLKLTIERAGKRMKIEVERSLEEPLGLQLKPFKIKTCRNRCIFCFVSQLPKGLRRSLYIKDEDFRMSFLYGNYITLTNLTAADKKRIINQRLSPLYISVHSTNREIRNKLLGNKNASDIIKELSWLAKNRIRFHTQI